MKKYIFLLLVSVLHFNLYAQTNNTNTIPKKLVIKKNIMLLMPMGMTNETVNKMVITFNKNGKTNSIQNFSRFNESLWRFEYRYNNLEKQIGKTEYGRQGLLKNFYIIRYDLLSRKIEDSVQSSMGRIISKAKYKYDAQGLLIQKQIFSEGLQALTNITY